MCHHPRPIRRFTTLLLLLSCSTCNQVEKLVVVSCWWWYRRGQVHYIYPLLAAPTDAWLIFIRFRSNNLWTCYSKMRLFKLLKKKKRTENYSSWIKLYRKFQPLTHRRIRMTISLGHPLPISPRRFLSLSLSRFWFNNEASLSASQQRHVFTLQPLQ